MNTIMSVEDASCITVNVEELDLAVVRFWKHSNPNNHLVASIYVALAQLDDITAKWADIRQAAEHDDLVKAGVDA